MFQKVAHKHLVLALALKEEAKPERVEQAPSQCVDKVQSEDSFVGELTGQQREDQDIRYQKHQLEIRSPMRETSD